MYYLKDVVSIEDLKECISNYILNDPETREKSMDEVIERMEKTFKNTRYRDRLNRVNSNWLNVDIENVLNELLDFVNSITE